MTLLIALVALVLAVVAISRASRAERQNTELRRRLEALEGERLGGERLEGGPRSANITGPNLGKPDAGKADTPLVWPPSPTTQTPTIQTVWPGSPVQQSQTPQTPTAPSSSLLSPQPQAPPAPPPKLPGPSLWGPEFSRARISLFGGALVLGGLAFTLEALGAPAWTLLLSVFAFAGLLYFNARRVPWPVSGVLRGLGYGVAALGLGTLATRLPGDWGPGAVLLGLFALSAGLLFDALRRREPLLGALAVGGAALSTWILTNDLGNWSILAAGLTLLLAAAAVQWTGKEAPTEDSPAERASQTPALILTLAIAGAVPLGWVFTSLSAVSDVGGFPFTSNLSRAVLMLDGGAFGGTLVLLPWLLFGLLALGLPLALLSRRPDTTPPNKDAPGLTLAAAWSILIPQAITTAAVASALSIGPRFSGQHLGSIGLTLLLLLGLAWAARQAWIRRTGELLSETISGSLIAAAASVVAALLLSLLGERTQPLALAGLATTLLLIGLFGHSRFWLRVGLLALAGLAVWGAAPIIENGLGTDSLFVPFTDWRAALLGLSPAALGLASAWRVSRTPWTGKNALGAALLAALCSSLIGLGLLAGGAGLLWLWCALAAALLLVPAVRQRFGTGLNFGPTFLAALLPGLILGALALPEGGAWLTVLRVTATLGAGLALIVNRAGISRAPGRRLGEIVALALLALAGARAVQDGWPALGWPGILALLTVLTSPLRLTLTWNRTAILLGLGLLMVLGTDAVIGWQWSGGALPVLGMLLLCAAWWLTRTASGLNILARLTARFGGLPPDTAPESPAARPWWLATLSVLTLLTLGLRLSGGTLSNGASWPLGLWLVAGSLAALAAGLHACWSAQSQTLPNARAVWASGLGVMLSAGVKAALVDAAFFGNPAAGVGVAVLATGLSLLAVAILFPRPAALSAPPA